MGLDITAQSHIEQAGLADEYAEELEDILEQGFINPHFPHAVPAPTSRQFLRYRLTDKTETHGFRAGSYGVYGIFRSILTEAFLGEKSTMSHNLFWENIEQHKGKPFYELINFTDCEGIMVGKICKILHADFVAHQSELADFLAKSDSDMVSYYIEKYEDWTRAFELASQDGILIFH